MKKNNRFRPSWADLPTDILSSIADRLGFFDLLSFRGTCKDFRRASRYASASIESSTRPWILAHHPDPDTGNCFLYIPYRRNPFTIHLPELKACMFLASYQGWMLVFKPKQGSMFFFSPFSRAKIHLPDFPINEIDQHATAFSDPPTSPHCILSIRTPDEVFVISRGQTTWTRCKIPNEFSSLWTTAGNNMSCAGFDHKTQTFYYLHKMKCVLRFSVKDCRVIDHPVNNIIKDIHSLPFRYCEDAFHQFVTHLKNRYKIEDPFHLQQGENLNICGCRLDNVLLPRSDQQLMIPNVFVKEDRGRHPDKRWGVWIQPRFFHPEPHHKWNDTIQAAHKEVQSRPIRVKKRPARYTD